MLFSAGCLNMVFSSTCAVYDGNTEVDLTEESPIGPINAYGGSKRATASSQARRNRFAVSLLRSCAWKVV